MTGEGGAMIVVDPEAEVDAILSQRGYAQWVRRVCNRVVYRRRAFRVRQPEQKAEAAEDETLKILDA
jgi:hypothetical protein